MRKTIPTLVLVAMCAAPAAAAPPTLTLKAAPTVVAYGGSTTLTGVLSTKKAGQAIDIQGQDCGQNAFKKVATATTTTGGAFSSAVKPTLNTNYQAKNKGATSPMVAVKVTPLLSLQKLSLGKFKVSVTAAQSFVGKYVVFQRLRNTKWVTLKKVTLATVATTTAPTQVTSSTFKIKLPAKLRVRSILPATQAATCYLPVKSKVIRS
ncbi:MAG: hypothetical protein E6F94_04900 [Actinobacteria bacterium]|nr:MAG: hypothetical protein E6G38_04020 [Actinomycetota bacterium]TMM26842.1 MAG: hypothetical protein E6F94_04900 [Actinomycetota bacterium]